MVLSKLFVFVCFYVAVVTQSQLFMFSDAVKQVFFVHIQKMNDVGVTNRDSSDWSAYIQYQPTSIFLQPSLIQAESILV